MPLFKYPTERVALKLRVPPGQFTSKYAVLNTIHLGWNSAITLSPRG